MKSSPEKRPESDWKRQVDLRALIAEVETEFPRQFWKARARKWHELLSDALPPFLCGLAAGILVGLFAAALYIRQI